MAGVKLWIFFALTASEGHAQTAPAAEAQCRTPKGEEGRCVDVRACPALLKIVANITLKGDVAQVPSPDTNQGKEIQFVKDSRCQGQHDYSVCCAFEQEPDCGNMYEERFMGDSTAAIDAFPWTVIVQHTRDNITRPVCGGSLVNKRYVLTAARCLQADQQTRSSVLLGESDRSTIRDCVTVTGGGTDCAEPSFEIAVERAVPHPEFDATTNDNDVALLKLKDDVKYSDFVRAICLPTSDPDLAAEAWFKVAGWGLSPLPGAAVPLAIKQQGRVSAITNEECQRNIVGSTLGINRMCTKGQVGGTKQPVDVGGALSRAATGVYLDGYRVEGVATMLPEVEATDGITVYAKVYPYVDWIRRTIKQ